MKHFPLGLMKEQTPSVLLKVEVLEKKLELLAQILALALSGLLVEACIIYRLHTLHSSENFSTCNTSDERTVAILGTRLNITEIKMEKMIEPKKEVAFTAVLQPAEWNENSVGIIGHFEEDKTLIYGKILTNVGGGYDPKTGIFTAPVKGLYFFTFTTYTLATEETVGVKLMKNDQGVLMAWENHDSGDDEDYASNSALLELEVMDKVYMCLPSGFRVAASKNSNINTFSGFLLHSK